MSVKLLTEHHLEFLSIEGGCTASSESTLVKMPHRWKSHVAAQLFPLQKLSCFEGIPEEGSGSVVEFLAQDQGVAGSSLTGITVCP